MARRPEPWYRKDRNAWFVTINGKRHNLGPNKKTAYGRFYELMREPEKSAVAAPESFAAIADAFLEWVQKNRAEQTYEWYRFRLQRFVESHPDIAVHKLKPFHVENWVGAFDISITSRRNYLRSVKRCMSWARRMGYIKSNPIEELEVPSGESREVVLSQDEFDELMSHVVDYAFADLLNVTWETGCRPQESLRVEANNVDLANRRWVFSKSKSKMKKTSRVIYLSDTAFDITKRLMAENPTGKLFRNARGAAWTKDSVGCAVNRIQIRMGKELMAIQDLSISDDEIAELIPELNPVRFQNGVETLKTTAELRCEAKRKLTNRLSQQLAPRYSLYALRHSFATNALKRGLDPVTISVLMGHDPGMFATVYQHLSLDWTYPKLVDSESSYVMIGLEICYVEAPGFFSGV